MSVEEHRKQSPKACDCCIVTVSDTRGSKEDKSGDLLVTKLEGAGHVIQERTWVKDDSSEIFQALDSIEEADAILLTGGTGLTARDITWQAVEAYCDEPLPAFAVLFTQLSYEQVGSAAVLSRATAGIKRVRNQLIVALPGSLKACTLAMDGILIPELNHIVGHLNK